jgi:hypothetical protein
MKRCPTCQRTFDDNMKFCQADGTPLVSDAAGAGGATEQSADFDPMKTVLGAPPQLDLPPPSPFGSSEPPRSSGGSDLNSPSFGDLGGSSPSNQPSGGFSDAPRTPTFQEPEPKFGQNFGQQPIGNAPSEWAPPPAPAQNWGNQGLGQNTPFSPPPAMAGAGGENKTLAIVSLVCGVLSCLCCISVLTGPAALITGFIANGNISKNPAMYGGKGLAMGGMITGALGTIIGILALILQLTGALANLGR